MPDQFTNLVYYLTYLLGCKDVDVFSVAGGSKLSDIFIVDGREINSKIEVDCSHHCRVCEVDNVTLGGREGGREGGRKGGREEGREGGREGGRQGGSKGGREGRNFVLVCPLHFHCG